jgi:elongation factor 1-alpha
MNTVKRRSKIALGIVGNVDSGKSTLAGHLLALTGYVSVHEQKKLDKEAQNLKRDSFRFAFSLDTLKEERERGVTIKETVKQFATKNNTFIISDLPGHSSFVKNFLCGATQLDIALLLIDVTDGIVQQTKEHLRIITINGIKRLIVLVNKMDVPTVNYTQDKFRVIEDQVIKLLSANFDLLKVLPISALTGDNIIDNNHMGWYKGPTLYEALDEEPEPELPIKESLRVYVTEVINKPGIGLIVQAKVSRGILKVNDKLIVKPSNVKVEVKSIEAFHKSVQEAYPNDVIGICLRNIKKEDIKKGYIISSLDDTPTNAALVDLEISVINPQVKLKEASDLLLAYGTGLVAVKIIKIFKVQDKLGNVKFEDNITQELSKNVIIERGCTASIRVKPSKIIPLELASKNPRLGICTMHNEKGVVASAAVINMEVDTSDL